MDFEFVTCPQGVTIDKTAPIMPRRSAADRRRYGIDPAWLAEMVARRRAIYQPWVDRDVLAFNLPPRPTASTLRTLRDQIDNISAYEAGSCENADSPPAHLPAYGDYSFDWQTEVRSGRPVKRAHTAELFNALRTRGRYVGCNPKNTGGYMGFDATRHRETYWSEGGAPVWPDEDYGVGNDIFEHYWQVSAYRDSESVMHYTTDETWYRNVRLNSTPPVYPQGDIVEPEWIASLARVVNFHVVMEHQYSWQDTVRVDKYLYTSVPVTIANGEFVVPFQAIIDLAPTVAAAAGAPDTPLATPTAGRSEDFSLSVSAYESGNMIATVADDMIPPT